MKKFIDGLLDTLLVIGAVACILTMGGGRLFIAGVEETDASMVPYMGNNLYWNERMGLDPAGIPATGAPAVSEPVQNVDVGGEQALDPDCPIAGERLEISGTSTANLLAVEQNRAVQPPVQEHAQVQNCQ